MTKLRITSDVATKVLEISAAAFDEIASKLVSWPYEYEGGVLTMDKIELIRGPEPDPQASTP